MDNRQRSKSLISKSRFKLATECPSKPHFSIRADYGNRKAEDDFLRALAKGGFQVGELACWYLPGGIHIETLNHEEALRETEKALTQENVTIYEAAFKHEHLLIRADVLIKSGTHLRLYEVKAKSFSGDRDEFYKAEKNRTEFDFLDSDWKEYFFDVAFQDYVIRRALPTYTLTSFLYLIDKSKVTTIEGLNQKFLIREVDGRISVVPEPGLKPTELGAEVLTPIDVTDDASKIQRHPEFWLIDEKRISFSEGLRILSQRHATGEKTKPHPTRECRKCEFRLVSDVDRKLGKSGFDECWAFRD